MARLRTFFGTAELACHGAGAGASFRLEVGRWSRARRPKGANLNCIRPPVKNNRDAKGTSPSCNPNAPAASNSPGTEPTSARFDRVAAYGQILPKQTSSAAFRLLNTTLAPAEIPGAAPVQWAILNDEPETGVTIMKMDEGLDTVRYPQPSRRRPSPPVTTPNVCSNGSLPWARSAAQNLPGLCDGQDHSPQQPGKGASYAVKSTRKTASGTGRNRAPVLEPGSKLCPLAALIRSCPLNQSAVASKSPRPNRERVPDTGEILEVSGNGHRRRLRTPGLRILVLKRRGKRLGARDFLAGHP